MNSKTLTRAALLLSLVLLCNTHTHAQQWQWARTYNGQTVGMGTGTKENYILRSHLDTAGNVYIFAKFGAGAYYNNTPGALDPERRSVDGWKNGVMVAKIGADGEFVWKKVVRTNRATIGYGHVDLHWAEFKEDAIYVMFNFSCNLAYASDKLHFFGEEKDRAEILATDTVPFKIGNYTALVKLSYDGEVLDQHFIQIRNRGDSSRTYLSPLSLFHVDNSGNTYIFCGINLMRGLPQDPVTLFFDGNDNTSYSFTVQKPLQGDEPIIIKLNANWQFVWQKSMYHNITDNSNVVANNPSANWLTGLSFDEDDNMYLTGIVDLGTVPLYIYFDEWHRLAMNDGSYLIRDNGYIVKYNTDGDVQWCNQLYSNSTSSEKNFEGTEISGNEVFVFGGSVKSALFYNGNEYIEFINPASSQTSSAFVAKFNKETGLYVNHGVVPNDNGLLSSYQIPSQFAKTDNYIIATTRLESAPQRHLIASFRTDNCQFLEVLDTIKFMNTTMGQTTGSVCANSKGDMFINFISPANVITLGNFPPLHTSGEWVIYALKKEPRLLLPYARVAVTGVTLNTYTTTLPVGATEQLFATVLPTNASNKSVSWSFPPLTTGFVPIASVNTNGVVTANLPGTTTITATTQDGNFIAQCIVTVTMPVADVTLNKDTVTLPIGATTSLTATVLPTDATNKTVLWSSSEPSIATVNKGVVTAVSEGTATITATTEDGNFTATCEVIVTVPVTDITLTPSAITLKVDDTEQLNATVLPTNATNKNVTWQSSAPAIASVDNNGIVTALSEGAATITVATEEGNHTAQCAVTVTPKSGIDKVWANGIKIYPNPVNGQLRITNYELREGDYTIFNVLGQTVGANLCVRPNGAETTIDVSHLPSGVYFIKIGNDVGKFVKE